MGDAKKRWIMAGVTLKTPCFTVLGPTKLAVLHSCSGVTGKEEGRKSRITVTCNGMQKECHPSDENNQLKSGLVTLISDNRHQLSIPK